MNAFIIQASEGGTGSTVVVNALYGFMAPNEKVTFMDPSILPAREPQGIEIIKIHTQYDSTYPFSFADKTNSPVFFVSSNRGVGVAPRNEKYNILSIPYEKILETDTYSLKAIVDYLYSELREFLPPEIDLNKPACLQRLRNMNARYEEIKDRPFSYHDKFYHLHGSHRGRWGVPQ